MEGSFRLWLGLLPLWIVGDEEMTTTPFVVDDDVVVVVVRERNEGSRATSGADAGLEHEVGDGLPGAM